LKATEKETRLALKRVIQQDCLKLRKRLQPKINQVSATVPYQLDRLLTKIDSKRLLAKKACNLEDQVSKTSHFSYSMMHRAVARLAKGAKRTPHLGKSSLLEL